MRALDRLLERCRAEGVRPVFAAERGSRCFGTQVASSDWDVQAIVANEPRAYASVTPPPPRWTTAYGDGVSITMFNVPRAALMLAKGNLSLYETAHSAAVVFDGEGWGERMRVLSRDGMDPYVARHQLAHRAEMAVTAIGAVSDLSGRRWLQLVLPLISAHLIDRDRRPPPVTLDGMLSALPPPYLADAAREALDAKRADRPVAFDAGFRDRLFGATTDLRRVLGTERPRVRPEGMDPAMLARADALAWDVIGIDHPNRDHAHATPSPAPR